MSENMETSSKGDSMSTDLTVLNNNALATGGVGLGSGLFRVKMQWIEIVQKTTRQEGAIPGKLRNTATGEHFDSMRVVLLAAPQEQREYYANDRGLGFSKEAKICYSLDGIQPHAQAREPKSLYCESCQFGNRMWARWRETHANEDLPKCQACFKVAMADRGTQTPYFMKVSGTSVLPFKKACEDQLAPLLQKLVAQVRMVNKQRGYLFDRSTSTFVPDPEFVLPEGKTQEPIESLPNIWDISFELFPTTRDKGGPPVIGCRDFRALQPKDKADFGALYLEFIASKQPDTSAVAEQEAMEAAVATTQPAPPVVLPGVPTGPVEGTVVVPKDVPITI